MQKRLEDQNVTNGALLHPQHVFMQNRFLSQFPLYSLLSFLRSWQPFLLFTDFFMGIRTNGVERYTQSVPKRVRVNNTILTPMERSLGNIDKCYSKIRILATEEEY
ncbi:hypothetical protein TNCV_884461 [Trichonephila clavipes]|nr:hypothetical protein TNCV_884461 [Trichonephila clavipes]